MVNTDDNNGSNGAVTPQLKIKVRGDAVILTKISEKVLQAYHKIALERGVGGKHSHYELSVKPVSGVGENSYGLILQVCMRECFSVARETEAEENMSFNHNPKEMVTILKISPKNPSFRAHSRIADLYKREVFMYKQVFSQFKQLQAECQEHQDNSYQFDNVPELLFTCLDVEDEFLILEDLSQSGFKQNQRTEMPTYELASATFRSIAKFHAMSFVLQAKKPQQFKEFVQQMDDNLFTEDIEPITVEFGKKYIRKTRVMLQQSEVKSQSTAVAKQIKGLQKLEDNFKRVCLQSVNGQLIAPYAVICHGDFWNNNMLYGNRNNAEQTTSAKLIDFQLSRYASPILDLVHYLYTSTEGDLRKKYFEELLDTYFEHLKAHISYHNLIIDDIYPKKIFMQQLKDYGIYGFCMAAFSIPFFISTSSELPDLDVVATAIRDISSTSSENSDEEMHENGNAKDADIGVTVNAKSDADSKRMELLEEYDLLNERTLPIFKRRMCDIVKDLDKYDMLDIILKLS
uniref:CHK kinase-like domain-containing protein n=1 Tax=Stomoxys calcitrans TaxID=35570 RepID=A0A1I8PPI3_STOCA